MWYPKQKKPDKSIWNSSVFNHWPTLFQYKDMIEESTTFKTGIDFVIPERSISTASSNQPPRSGGSRPSKPTTPGAGLGAIESVFKNGDISLPTGVNFVALRETFLSEAPFVNRGNRKFWKKWIDSRQFNNVFAGSMRMMTECIIDNGTIDAKKLFVLPSRLSLMAMSTRFDNDPVLANAHTASSSSHHIGSNPASRPFSPAQTNLSELMNTRGFGDADPYAFTAVSKHHLATNGEELAKFQSMLLEKISLNIAEMMMMGRDVGHGRSRAHDVLFSRLPELLCFMIVNACIYALPKLTRLFNAVRFREMVLDWLNEMIGGIRITNCQLNREWLFKDAYDTNILIVDPPNNLSTVDHEFPHLSPTKKAISKRKAALSNSQSLPPLSPGGGHTVSFNTAAIAAEQEKEKELQAEEEQRFFEWRKTSCSGAKSSFYLNNSPIVCVYMNSSRGPHDKPFVSGHNCKLTITHVPDRPVLSMQPQNVVQERKFREKRMNSVVLDKTIQIISDNRKLILAEKQRAYNDMVEDVKKISLEFKAQMELLEKRPITMSQRLALLNTSGKTGASTSNFNSASNSVSGGASVSDGSLSTTA